MKSFRTLLLPVLFLLLAISIVAGFLPVGSAMWISPSEAATISLNSISHGYFTAGETITANLTVKNTGNARWTFYVGLSLQDVNLKWWNASYTQIALDPGAQSTMISPSWQIEAATPTGPMTGKVTVWANQIESHPITELASAVEENAFSVYPASAKRPTGVTALWIDSSTAYPANSPTAISTLLAHGVNMIFLNVGCLDSVGGWNPPNRLNYNQFVLQAKVAGLSVIAWINQGGSCGDVSGQDMQNPTTRTNVANVVSTLTSGGFGFDGVQFDVEPVAWDSTFLSGYIGLLGAVRPLNYTGHLQVYVPIGSMRYADDSDFLSGFLSKLSQVGVTEVVDSVYNTERKSVSTYQSLLITDTRWMTANSKIKVIFGLPAYDEKTTSHDPSVENIGNALIGIWMALSFSAVNQTQFGGVAIYSYLEFDTNKWSILDQLWTSHAVETLSTTSTTIANASSTMATTTSTTTQEQPLCVIATAAYGSELAPPVQFLRDFRDRQVQRTYFGRQFLSAFNAWYYTWAPSVAQQEAKNPLLQAAIRGAILPLLGALFITEQVFTGLSSISSEFAIVVSGLTASSLIGAAYLTPLVYLGKRLLRRRLTRRTFPFALIVGLLLALWSTLGYGSTAPGQILDAALVIEPILAAPLIITQKLAQAKPRAS